MRILTCLALAAATALPAPAFAAVSSASSAPVMTEADYERLVQHSVDGYIVPAYEDLVGTTKGLSTAISAYCAAPDAKGRDAVDTAFGATLLAWAKVDFIKFGPIESEERYDRFAFWPDEHGTGALELQQMLERADLTLVGPGALASASPAVQGLPALEALLYPGADALLNDSKPEHFRCAFAGAIAANLNGIATAVLSGWQGERGWAAMLENPEPGNPVYRSQSEAASEILGAILTGLVQTREEGLVPTVGATPAAANRRLAPDYRSGQTMTYLEASSAALQRLIAASGMLEMLPPSQQGQARAARLDFSNLDKALQAAGPDIRVALADPDTRARLGDATTVLASLRRLFEHRIAAAAGLSPRLKSL